MNVHDAILGRRSLASFADTEVSPDDIMEMIDAARHAPSAGNLQPWKFVLVKNKEKRASLADAAYQQTWMADAPVHIVVVGMEDDVKRMYGVKGETMYVIQDVAMAIENMLLRAVDLGLGAHFVRAFEEGMVRRIVKVPDHMRPLGIVCVGYSDDTPRKKVLKTFENITYFESYGNRTEDYDEAFYTWSGMMKKQADKILEKFKKGSDSLRAKIEEKWKR